MIARNIQSVATPSPIAIVCLKIITR
jgi:hypothetical protein